jgi:deazaflavin-dependent oxidoreductase (nitroreductase family)
MRERPDHRILLGPTLTTPAAPVSIPRVTRTYRLSSVNRLINAVFSTLTRLGLGRRERHIITVVGRKSGRPRSTPIDVISADGERWLVAGYGVSAWVHNLRAAGKGTLSRGRRTEPIRAVELDLASSVPILRRYLHAVRVVRPYFQARIHSGDEDFLADAAQHPVFRVLPPGG